MIERLLKVIYLLFNKLSSVGMVGWTDFGVTGVFFLHNGYDYKCYILLHMLGLVNMDSFSNNIF
jgi:hypothetical protein